MAGKRGYGKAEWIASFLPHTPDSCYIEPFAGMAAVLLARPPVDIEILNDANWRIVNWWMTVIDESEEFGRLIDFMLFSRAEFRWAKANMDNPDLTPLRRALAFHVAVEQGVVHSDMASGGWGRKITPAVGSVARIWAAHIAAIAERLRDVPLEYQDACDLLERVKGCDYAVIYADPPYRTVDVSAYPINDLDIDRCVELLAAQRGAVGISGYGNEWDMLGWRRVERPALRRQIKGNSENRMEVLWLNDKASATRPGLFG